MIRRDFIGMLVAALLPMKKKEVPPFRRDLVHKLSALECLEAGLKVVAVHVALVDVNLTMFPDKDFVLWDSKSQLADIPAKSVTARGRVSDVRIVDGWLRTSSPHLKCVTGAESNLVIALEFNNGAIPVISRLSGATFIGLPVTPNGGDITINWDGCGILQLL